MTVIPVRGGAALRAWLAAPLAHDVRRSLERVARLPDVAHVAVMPDVHLAGDVCVGTVLATRATVYPAAVGGDIGCGMTAVAIDCGADVLHDEATARWLLEAVTLTVPTMRHPRHRSAPAVPRGLMDEPLSRPSLETLRRRDGCVQFATLGRGNHFIEFQRDESDGRLWLMVHSGSRAMGPFIRDVHVGGRVDRGARTVGLTGDSAAAYVHDADWARRYAAASRRAMVEAVAAPLRGRFGAKVDWATSIECDHNHVAREEHFEQDLWIHRKGAARAEEAEPGILPGSMGTVSFHTLGRGCATALRSSAHGAGRALPRDLARRRIRAADVARQMCGVWFDADRAHDLIEEAPAAYKDVNAVMRAQHDLTRIVRRLRPVLVYKG